MITNLIESYPIEMLCAFGVMAALTVASFIIAIVAVCKTSSIKRKYNEFMKGGNGQSIEKLIKDNIDSIANLKKVSDENSKAVKDIYNKLQYTFQKVGIVKYDAFNEMGGKLSFSLCMLDRLDNGYIINVMHSNNGCFAYIKEIISGESYIELGEEEKKALSQALAGRNGDEELSKAINDKIDNEM